MTNVLNSFGGINVVKWVVAIIVAEILFIAFVATLLACVYALLSSNKEKISNGKKKHNKSNNIIAQNAYIKIAKDSDKSTFGTCCDGIAIGMNGASQYKIDGDNIYCSKLHIDLLKLHELMQSALAGDKVITEAFDSFKDFLSFVCDHIDKYKICAQSKFTVNISNVEEEIKEMQDIEGNWVKIMYDDAVKIRGTKYGKGYESLNDNVMQFNVASMHMHCISKFASDLWCMLHNSYANIKSYDPIGDVCCDVSFKLLNRASCDYLRSQLRDLTIKVKGIVEDFMSSNPHLKVNSYSWINKLDNASAESIDKQFEDAELVPR